MIIRKSLVKDVPSIMDLLQIRIDWMDEKGLYQWNKTDYLGVYPSAYFIKLVNRQVVYVAKEADCLQGVMALFSEDPRWTKSGKALYVHHLATDLSCKGLGAEMLCYAETEAIKHGCDYLRLDCQIVNLDLNRYYERLGYICVGTCIDGAYEGNLMEKPLVGEQIDYETIR